MLKNAKKINLAQTLENISFILHSRNLRLIEIHALFGKSSDYDFVFLVYSYHFILTFGGVEGFWTNFSTSQC